MKKSKGIVSLILVIAITVLLGFTCYNGIGANHTGSARNIKLGLDLAGGVSITYQAKNGVPSSEDMSDTVYKMQKRVEQYSTEASVYQEGDDRINIEIPGVSDANAILEELGKPGSLEFVDPEGNVEITGSDVKTANVEVTQNSTTGANEYIVSLKLTEEGAEKFKTATTEHLNEQISIVYDSEVISSPVVNSVISGGEATISGMADREEAENLAATIRIGGLKVELEELRSNVVGAQLGGQAIRSSIKAAVIGLVIICVFMCAVYLLPGLASSISLLLYTGIVIGALNAFDITLTLPGIAGIILGIGMAVDANVIIFARVKEEIAAGISVRGALKNGFQKAMSAIIDGNVTTLIAAIVLGLMGSGTVKGFAQTLALGIVVSMFTALVVTRIIVFAFYAVGIQDKKFYAREWKKERKTIDFLSKKKLFFIASTLAIVIGFVAMGYQSMNGKGALNYSLEFKGGTATTVEFKEDYTIEEIEEKIIPVVEDAVGDKAVQTQKVKDSTQVIIKTKTLDLEGREALNSALVEAFGVDDSTITAENISSTVSSEMRSDAIKAVLVATICMLIYIWFRFKDICFATSAVAALVHDVLVVLTFYALARVSVGNTFIACMLTIVGYSINATIVIFDRIREELKTKDRNASVEDIVNRSISHTLTRTLYTSFTTIVMVAVLYVLGVSSVKEFAAPLMVGFICGAYSSVCITGALWYVMKSKLTKDM